MSRNSRLWPGIVAPGAIYHLLASTAFIVVFAIVPFSLYLHSGEEWALAPVLLLKLAALGLLALLATALGLRLLAALSRSAATGVAIALFCLGLFVLLAHVYAPVAIGPLDGEEIRSDEPLSYTLIEGALLAGAVILFILLRRGRGLVAASAFAGILWLVGLGYGVAAVWPASDTTVATVDSADIPRPAACGATGNVYQIVLDTLETDAFLEVIRENDWAGKFEGFDLFFNNIGNYIRTKNSKASYLTGRFYHSGEFGRWWEAFSEGLFRHLSEEGFANWTYVFRDNENWRHPYADVLRSNTSVYQERVGAPESEFHDLLTVWFSSLAPNPLTNESLGIAERVADLLFASLSSGPATEDDPHGFNGLSSVLLLDQLIRDEAARTPACNYVYAHAVIPHAPYVLDGRCRYVGDPQDRPQVVDVGEAYLQQSECSIRKVLGFLQEIKRLDRFDSATIVLHADTGSQRPFRSEHPKNEGVEVLGKPKAAVLSLMQALLMIKRPHHREPLAIVEAPTQLVDIYPTVLDILGIEAPEGLHGRSVYASDAPPREARFALDPEDPGGSDLIEVRIDEPTNLATSSLTVIGPATDPALWRDEIKRAYARSPHAEDVSRSTVTGNGRRGSDRTTQ